MSTAEQAATVRSPCYGVYITDHSSLGSTSSFNLYSAGATAKNYFAAKWVSAHEPEQRRST